MSRILWEGNFREDDIITLMGQSFAPCEEVGGSDRIRIVMEDGGGLAPQMYLEVLNDDRMGQPKWDVITWWGEPDENNLCPLREEVVGVLMSAILDLTEKKGPEGAAR